ncbi:protein kinase [Chitinophaga agrisoli]|uniref:Protein kinase n=1 Tax=Chitinophaga agrisoli TaxID=2607653 RepID=A0A5B2VM50_9BACT|nr:lanthionine synthetase LanC family protein [Chitinophaga agrisoli]KAA2239730.1 protein kinase [Chitinophaga agrisoli]
MKPAENIKPDLILEETQIPLEEGSKGKVEKIGGKRIGYYYIIIKSLKESKKNDVVRCVYIKGMFNFGICVIKEGTYGDTKDKHGRDIIDRLQWQKKLHQLLHGKIRLPKLLGSFEENGNYYLVLERIKGVSLAKAIRAAKGELRDAIITGNKLGITFIKHLIELIRTLNTLHQHQIVHRDVTPANFMITPSGKVSLIDMELSYLITTNTPNPPFTLGTYGYMSPEQQAVDPNPTIKEDIFSVGAIILYIWSGIHPLKLVYGTPEDIASKVQFFIPEKTMASLVTQSLMSPPSIRPSLKNIEQALLKYKDSVQKTKKNTTADIISKEQVLPTLQEAIHTLGSPLLADEQGWFSANVNHPFDADTQKIIKAKYASFTGGDSGILYLLACAKKTGLDVSHSLQCVDKSLTLIEKKYINRLNKAVPGLYYGADGIAVCLSTAIDHGLINCEPMYQEWINKLLGKKSQTNNLMYGISGQGIANILCEDFIPSNLLQKRLTEYVQHLIDHQEKDGSWVRAISGNKKRITRGLATGVAGISYFLLSVAQKYNSSDALKAGQLGLGWLMKKSIHKDNMVQWLSSTNDPIMPWWNDGAPGIAIAFLKAYELTQNKDYRKYAIGALSTQKPHVVYDNLSQHQGLSGLGEVYLEAYKILKDDVWYERASWIAQIVMLLRRTHPQFGPYWLVEDEKTPVAGFMLGNSGVLHFLLRYCNPTLVNGPLMT